MPLRFRLRIDAHDAYRRVRRVDAGQRQNSGKVRRWKLMLMLRAQPLKPYPVWDRQPGQARGLQHDTVAGTGVAFGQHGLGK